MKKFYKQNVLLSEKLKGFCPFHKVSSSIIASFYKLFQDLENYAVKTQFIYYFQVNEFIYETAFFILGDFYPFFWNLPKSFMENDLHFCVKAITINNIRCVVAHSGCIWTTIQPNCCSFLWYLKWFWKAHFPMYFEGNELHRVTSSSGVCSAFFPLSRVFFQ